MPVRINYCNPPRGMPAEQPAEAPAIGDSASGESMSTCRWIGIGLHNAVQWSRGRRKWRREMGDFVRLMEWWNGSGRSENASTPTRALSTSSSQSGPPSPCISLVSGNLESLCCSYSAGVLPSVHILPCGDTTYNCNGMARQTHHKRHEPSKSVPQRAVAYAWLAQYAHESGAPPGCRLDIACSRESRLTTQRADGLDLPRRVCPLDCPLDCPAMPAPLSRAVPYDPQCRHPRFPTKQL